MNPGSFFSELRRRNIFRVAAAYAIVSWLIIQVATSTFPVLEIPSWCVRLVIVLVALGFPVAMLFAWAYELTPEGLKRTEDVEPTPAARRPVTQRLNRAIIAVPGWAVASLLYQLYHPGASLSNTSDKSIAVLPFENFSDDKDNAYFADGIQDDILTNLSKIGDLKVISRTSVMPYRGKEKNLREIGKALGVSAILEGSVRRSGNRVRVNVQLINAVNDEHIWSDVYDRDLTDVFTIQTDLAKKIAQELSAKLSPTEKEQMTRKPTENGEAYLAFVQAHNFQREVE